MKIAITGVAGLIGSNIAKHMIAKGHEVVGIDSMISGYHENIPKDESFELRKFDIVGQNSTSNLKNCFWDCDVVYHAAAHAHEGLSIWSPSDIVTSVVGGTVAVASACAASGVKRMINFSSMSRYGEAFEKVTEESPINPVDPYALAKVQAENQAEMIGEMHGFEVVHAVPHMCIGVGQVYNDPFRNICGIATNRLLQGKTAIVYGDGSQRRCFSAIEGDLIAYEGLADIRLKEQGELYHMGISSKEMTIMQVTEFICDHLNISSKFIEKVNKRPGDLQRSLCSSEKAKSEFGKANISLEESLVRQIEWIKSIGTKKFNYYIDLEIKNEKTPKTWTQEKI